MVSEVEVRQTSPWRRHLRTPVGTLGFLLQLSRFSGMPLQGIVKWCQLLGGVPPVGGSHTAGVLLLPECLLVQDRQPRSLNHWSLILPNLLPKAVDEGQSSKLGQGCMGILGYAAVFNLFSEYSTIHNLTTKTV